MRKLLILAGLIAAFGSAYSAAPAPGYVTKEILRTATTVSGQPLKIAQGRPELVASASDFAPNGRTPVHQHLWSRFVYIERGSLKVTYFARHRTDEFKAGQAFAEAAGEWHQGQAGPQGARLVVFDLVPPGVKNVVTR